MPTQQFSTVVFYSIQLHHINTECNLSLASASLGSHELVDYGRQLVAHQLVVDYYRDLLALLVPIHRLPHHSQVLLLCPQVVENYHLHVHPVVPLLQQPLLLTLLSSLLNLHAQLSLNRLHTGLRQLDDRDGFAVLLHLAVNCSLVEVGGDDVVLLLAGLRLEQFFLELHCEVYGSHRYSVLFLLLVETGEVVKAEYFEFSDEGCISQVFVDAGEHEQRDRLAEHLIVSFEIVGIVMLECLHGYSVGFLHEIDDELFDGRQGE